MEALSLNDPRWKKLSGGYRVPFDASVPLRELAIGADPSPIWEQLWSELHHQGAVGEASYAAVPHLVEICRRRGIADWNLFGLIATIEASRDSAENPDIPHWLIASYCAAWEDLFRLGLETLATTTDELTVRSILGAIAMHRGLRKLGRIIGESDSSEIDALYAETYGDL